MTKTTQPSATPPTTRGKLLDAIEERLWERLAYDVQQWNRNPSPVAHGGDCIGRTLAEITACRSLRGYGDDDVAVPMRQA